MIKAALVALLALAGVPLVQAPAVASNGRSVVGTGCHDTSGPQIGLLGVAVYQSTDCITVDASSDNTPYGVAVLASAAAYNNGLASDPSPETIVVTLDCLVIEDFSWGQRVFASGADAAGTRHSIAVTGSLTRPGFVAGTAAGSAPCGAWDREYGVTGGGFQVTPSSTENSLPTAAFTHRCDGLTCTFDATGSSDPDGTVVRYRWDFGDYGLGTGATVTHTYSGERDAQVKLTVVDDDGGAHETTRTITTSTSPAYTLAARLVQQGKRLKVVLDWTGALTSTVHISRNSAHLATVPDNGSYSDVPAAGTYTYRVCDATRTRCSNAVTVSL